MSILRTTVVGLTGLGAIAVFSISVAAGGQQTAKPSGAPMAMPMANSHMSRAQKIANAMTAAPASISAKATIMDWPAKEGDKPSVLRAGTNGWSCFPDMPDSKGNDPTCLDDQWMKWIDAYLAHKTPEVTHVGFGYMLGPGGAWGSNTDPYAMAETKDNQWGLDGPHVMILVPDLKSLAGMPTDRKSGGPFVMYAGTPYAHIMEPIKPPTTAGAAK